MNDIKWANFNQKKYANNYNNIKWDTNKFKSFNLDKAVASKTTEYDPLEDRDGNRG